MLPRACHPVTPLLLGYRPRVALSQTTCLRSQGWRSGVQGLVGAPNQLQLRDE